MRRVKRLVTCVVTALFVCIPPLALANRARFWWQELVVNYALVLLTPSIFACCYLCVQKLPGRIGALIKVVALILTAYHILFVGRILFPYESSPSVDSVSVTHTATKFSIGYIERFSSWPELQLFIERHTPDILIVQGFPRSQEARVLKLFKVEHLMSKGGASGILVASQYPTVEVVIAHLGIHAHAGGALRVKIAQGIEPLLGVVALEPSMSAETFERNRVTSRRMASILRNTPGHRAAFLRLASTPFSQFAYVFQDQTDMRSFLFNRGLRTYIRLGERYGLSTLHNMYYSPDMNCVASREEKISGSQWLCVCSVDSKTQS